MTLLTLLIAFIIWWIAGTTACIYWWTEEFEVTVLECVLASIIGAMAGPFLWVVGALLHFDFKFTKKVVFKKRTPKAKD
jgi:hypothetical protein